MGQWGLRAAGSMMLLVCWCPWAAGAAYTADGWALEVDLVPDKAEIMVGEPIWLSFTIRNQSDQDLQVVETNSRNQLGRPEGYTITATAGDGTLVPVPDAGPSFGGMVGPQKIQAKGSYARRLFLPNWARFERPGDYSLACKREMRISEYRRAGWDPNDKATTVAVQVAARIKVVPTDHKKMGEVIAALGEAMLGAKPDIAEDACRSLDYVDDERVIGYFLKAVETRNYGLKFTALRALGRFNTDQALEGLKKGAATAAADIANTTTRDVAAQCASNIRHAAAGALARSPHPGAMPLLWAMRNDTYSGVRITVLHAVAKMKPDIALPRLREMARDADDLVRREAERYLAELAAKPSVR